MIALWGCAMEFGKIAKFVGIFYVSPVILHVSKLIKQEAVAFSWNILRKSGFFDKKMFPVFYYQY